MHVEVWQYINRPRMATPILTETDSSRLAHARDCVLLDRPAGLPRATRAQLRNALRMALLASSKQELECIAYRVYQGRKVDDVAARVDLSPARVRELLESLRCRAAAVQQERTRQDRIERKVCRENAAGLADP